MPVITKQFQNLTLPQLGFGSMRLPLLPGGGDENVDQAAVDRMVDTAMARGANYFDTAYGYHGGKSEVVIGKALSRYPRDSYYLASKFPGYDESNIRADKVEAIFEEQLKKCGVEYFDMYLMHAQSAGRFEFYKSCRAYETAFALKAEGRVRHVGISFHDTAPVLERILTEYPQLDFVQLQFNYLDYEDPQVQSRACYEVCRRHQKPVVVMEPVRGGRLARLSGEETAALAALALLVWLAFFIISGSLTVPLLRTGFRMVVFSVIIMIVVLFFRRGIMGDKEFSDILFARRKASGKGAVK